jgi:hypothetical protein
VRQHVSAEADRVHADLANLGRRYGRTAGGSYTAFSCPRCGALFGDWYLSDYIL